MLIIAICVFFLSVDFETDKKIQVTIREEMVDSTIVCIAHRLRTVMDYDRVMVMDAGIIAEFGAYTLFFHDVMVKLNGFSCFCRHTIESH